MEKIMSNIIVANSDIITVEYVPDKQMIYHVIHKPVAENLKAFQDALDAGTQALKTYGVSKWLSDDRKNGPLPPEQYKWLETTQWSLNTIKLGWKYWANVVPQEIAAAGTLTALIDDLYTHDLHLMVFISIEAAQKWLDQYE